MPGFEFATATRIIFGNSRIRELPVIAKRYGQRILLVGGRSKKRTASVKTMLADAGFSVTCYSVTAEPTIEAITEGVLEAGKGGCQMVVGMGGGSVIDAAKAIAALMKNPGDIMQYLEVIGEGKPLTKPAAPFIAIPTTAGTGAEVTSNAVLGSPAHHVKVSLRHPSMLPAVALVDPKLTAEMPPSLTASTGLDALTQLLESFVSKKSNPLTETICREGLVRIAGALYVAFNNGNDATAREDMAIASLFGGLALANSKLGAVHGFAGPMGGMFPVPHGVVCGRILPFVMAANVKALKAQANTNALARFDEVAKILTGDMQAEASDGIAWIEALCAVFKLPPLSNYGISKKDFPQIVAQAQKASSMQGNPVTLTAEELTGILEKVL
jgi:alcohol dehydrogenase class IV